MRPAQTLLLCAGLAVALAGCTSQADKGKDAAVRPGSAVAQSGLVTLSPDSPKLQQIRVEAVRTAQVPTDEVVTPGKIEVNGNHVSRVLLPVPGRVATVLVHLGDAVSAGQPVLTLESPDADAAESNYLQAEALVTQAKATRTKAQADYDRAKDLFDHNAIARKEVLNADNALQQAKAGLDQSEAAREQALRRLRLWGLEPGHFGDKIVVRAPLAGKVLEMAVVAGEYRNDTNVAVMTIANLSTVWVSADVPESYIRFVQTGEPVEIELAAYPSKVFHGRVTRIADTVDPQTRTVKVRAEMENRDGRLRPEMFGRVRHTEGMRAVPAVPVGAVIQGDGKNVVYREKGPGVFETVEVKVGKRAGDLLPVLAGLNPGDRVVVDGAMLLRTY